MISPLIRYLVNKPKLTVERQALRTSIRQDGGHPNR